jgi:vitamin B12 transporter
MKGLEAWGQYTYTLTRNFDSPDLMLGGNKRLPRWPIDQVTAGVAYQPVEAVRLVLDYRFVGARNNDLANSPAQRMGSFGVVNVAASYQLNSRMQVYGRVDNLFNEHYEEILDFGTRIRSVYGGVRVTL